MRFTDAAGCAGSDGPAGSGAEETGSTCGDEDRDTGRREEGGVAAWVVTTQFHLAPSHFHLPAATGAGDGFVGGAVEVGASAGRGGVGADCGGRGLGVVGEGFGSDGTGAGGFGLDTTVWI